MRYIGMWLGVFITITLLARAESEALPLLAAPFGATAVLLFALPTSPLARFKNVLGGHMITAAIGVMAANLPFEGWWIAGAAVATGIVAMVVSDTIHPPAGANPLVALALPEVGWEFILFPVGIGALIMFFISTLYYKGYSRLGASQ